MMEFLSALRLGSVLQREDQVFNHTTSRGESPFPFARRHRGGHGEAETDGKLKNEAEVSVDLPIGRRSDGEKRSAGHAGPWPDILLERLEAGEHEAGDEKNMNGKLTRTPVVKTIFTSCMKPSTGEGVINSSSSWFCAAT